MTSCHHYPIISQCKGDDTRLCAHDIRKTTRKPAHQLMFLSSRQWEIDDYRIACSKWNSAYCVWDSQRYKSGFYLSQFISAWGRATSAGTLRWAAGTAAIAGPLFSVLPSWPPFSIIRFIFFKNVAHAIHNWCPPRTTIRAQRDCCKNTYAGVPLNSYASFTRMESR